MRTMNVPRLGALYWVTLALASVFGTNTGDVISHTLHLGDYAGIPVLLLMFAAILFTERRARMPDTLYYWLAIIVLRTAATNLADLSTLQLELDYETVVAGLAVLLAVILWLGRLRRAIVTAAGGLSVDGVYWIAMLTAATLGTALGDFGSHTLSLRVSSVISVALFGVALSFVRGATSGMAVYWCGIVTARAAGTNIGDLLAFRKGLNLGLPISTLVTGLLFFGLVLFGTRRRSIVPQDA